MAHIVTHPDNEPEFPPLKYRWGFDVFRTRSQIGFGFALSFRDRHLIGLWVGPWYLTYGQQIVWEDWACTTCEPSPDDHVASAGK